MKENKFNNEEETAYLYIAKNPSYNDICLVAYSTVLYKGTPVMFETRYGTDLGFIIGFAPIEEENYEKGNTNIKGACIGLCEQKDDYNENEHQCSYCSGCESLKIPKKVKIEDDIVWVDHLASPAEMAKYNENKQKQESAIIICKEKILKHKLNMKLIGCHFIVGESKVIFFFTADERVDFRDLVKDLVAVFKIRIELRQIGVRDESRLIGGLSVCGRDYCCHSITDKLEPVSIKMAKEQNLSLNSMKISGPCGRLLCCLSFEYDYYLEEKSNLPMEGTKIKLAHELWRVSEINILSRKIMLLGTDSRIITVPCDEFYFDEKTNYWKVKKSFEKELFSTE